MTRSEISDRHLRDADGLASADQAQSLSVGIVLDEEWSHSIAGQLMLSCLVNLLCRQTDLVSSIDVIAADTELLIPMPNETASGTFLDAIECLSAWATGGEIPVTIDAGQRPDIRLAIGRWGSPDDGTPTIVGYGHGWRAWVGSEGRSFEPGASSNPLGPFLAATIMAGEVFKLARGITRGRRIEKLAYSLWSGVQGTEFDEVDDGPELAGRDLPPFYLAGAGAVGQGLAYVLGSAELGSGYIVGIDDDAHDKTNLNRCFLAGAADDGKSKLIATGRFLSRSGLDFLPRDMTVLAHVTRPSRTLRSDLAALQREGEYRVFASCVDKNTSRNEIQALHPELVVGGSTKGLSAKANVYEPTRGTACLACHNPPEDDGDRLRKFGKMVRSMSESDQRAFLSGRVPNVDAVISYIKDQRCSTVGEKDFKQAAIDQGREFSVSFVSMAAGVLLAGRLLQRLLFDDVAPCRLPMTTLAFLAGRIEDSVLASNSNCACRR